ncbi:MAG: DUF1501 domain-containing protein [Mycobacteriales bacterium]|nr:DUF1501 domain-containing protein [Frankia sp.]
MAITRRQLLAGVGGAAGAHVLAPTIVGRGMAFGATSADPSTSRRNRVLVVFQQGGNDGLNTVIPTGDVRGAPRYSVYRKVRPSIGYAPGATLPLNRGADVDHKMGLNAQLKTVHKLYGQGRVAIVQGVDYPKHNYSHFESTDIWESGEPGQAPDSGWLGRHLDRAGIGDGELRGLGIGYQLPLILTGKEQRGVEIASIAATHFADGTGATADPRHAAFAGFGNYPGSEPLRAFAGKQARATVELVDYLRKVPVPKAQNSQLLNDVLAARTLLEQDIGVECAFVVQSGYDTHTGERQQHETLLTELDQAIEALYYGTANGASLGVGAMKPQVASRLVVMTISEFGRRIGENGSGAGAGTDHGAAAPVFLIGPTGAGSTGRRLVAGLHGDHSKMGTTALPADNLAMTTDLRGVYQAVLQNWLRDPDPLYDHARKYVGGLFS